MPTPCSVDALVDVQEGVRVVGLKCRHQVLNGMVERAPGGAHRGAVRRQARARIVVALVKMTVIVGFTWVCTCAKAGRVPKLMNHDAPQMMLSAGRIARTGEPREVGVDRDPPAAILTIRVPADYGPGERVIGSVRRPDYFLAIEVNSTIGGRKGWVPLLCCC